MSDQKVSTNAPTHTPAPAPAPAPAPTESHEDHCPVCRRREEAELARLKATQNRWVQRCTMVAECLNRLRIIPRIIVGSYGYLVWMMVQWFMGLEAATTQQVTLVTAIAAMAPVVFGFYMNGGTSNKGGNGASHKK